MNIVLLLQIFILLPAFVLHIPGLPYYLGALIYVTSVLFLSFNTNYGYQKKEHNTLDWLSISGILLIPVMSLVAIVIYFSCVKYSNLGIDDATALLIAKYFVIAYYLITTAALGSLFEKEKGAFDLVFIMIFGSINALTCFFFIRLIFETVNTYMNLLL